ncbi:MAG: pyridoxal phosphate-dependent class II aminotransferase [Thermodesulfobacteria bacterium]|nr:pyridoxal phosphate-dependent class II aminotransferase [Thermodesulfobacteriota bacterium]
MLHGHGGDVYSIAAELGVSPLDVLDFSSNCSPLPYPKGFHDYLCDNVDQMHLLPEVDSITIRNKLAKRYNRHPDRFLIGSGTTQWIYALPRLLGSARAFVTYPTYADYEDACKAAGVEVVPIGIYPGGSQQDGRRLLQDLDALKPATLEGGIVFICNPNNPTGLFLGPQDLLAIIKSKPRSTVWVIDESYAPFVGPDEYTSLLGHSLPENVVILRSFSKIYGIPGLRVGGLVGSSPVLEGLVSQMRPWSVNRMAQLALEYLLDEPQFEQEVRDFCQKEKEFFVDSLSKLHGMSHVEGRCHYALFRLSGGLRAQELASELRKRGMLIRDCHNFKGLEGDYVRISPRLHPDNERLVDEIYRLCEKT